MIHRFDRRWCWTAALVMVIGLLLLTVVSTVHGQSLLFFPMLEPLLLMLSMVIAVRETLPSRDRISPLEPVLRLASLSHLPPPRAAA